MIKFHPSRQPIRRTPRFAACGLAAVAIVAAGLSVCVPTKRAPAVHATIVEGAPPAISIRVDQSAFRDHSRAIQLPDGTRAWTQYDSKPRTDIGARPVDSEILRRANEARRSLMTHKRPIPGFGGAGHGTDHIRKQLMALVVEQRRVEKLAGEFLRNVFARHPLTRIYVLSAYPVGLLASHIDKPNTTSTTDFLVLPYAPLEWMGQMLIEQPLERIYSRKEARIVPRANGFMQSLMSRKYIEIEMNLGVQK